MDEDYYNEAASRTFQRALERVREDLANLLSLCDPKQQDIFNRMYRDGIESIYGNHSPTCAAMARPWRRIVEMNPSVYSLVKLFCICCWVFFCLFPAPSKIYGPSLKGGNLYAFLMLIFLVGGIISGAILCYSLCI